MTRAKSDGLRRSVPVDEYVRKSDRSASISRSNQRPWRSTPRSSSSSAARLPAESEGAPESASDRDRSRLASDCAVARQLRRARAFGSSGQTSWSSSRSSSDRASTPSTPARSDRADASHGDASTSAMVGRCAGLRSSACTTKSLAAAEMPTHSSSRSASRHWAVCAKMPRASMFSRWNGSRPARRPRRFPGDGRTAVRRANEPNGPRPLDAFRGSLVPDPEPARSVSARLAAAEERERDDAQREDVRFRRPVARRDQLGRDVARRAAHDPGPLAALLGDLGGEAEVGDLEERVAREGRVEQVPRLDLRRRTRESRKTLVSGAGAPTSRWTMSAAWSADRPDAICRTASTTPASEYVPFSTIREYLFPSRRGEGVRGDRRKKATPAERADRRRSRAP